LNGRGRNWGWHESRQQSCCTSEPPRCNQAYGSNLQSPTSKWARTMSSSSLPCASADASVRRIRAQRVTSVGSCVQVDLGRSEGHLTRQRQCRRAAAARPVHFGRTGASRPPFQLRQPVASAPPVSACGHPQ
jgi:hypothetical protein